MLRWLSRLYSLMLWAYPADFRREYGQEMTTAFRTRAREIESRQGTAALAPFMAHIIWDWLGSSARESNNMSTRMPMVRWIAAFPLAMLAAYAAMRATGFAITATSPADPRWRFQYLWIWSSVGYFSMAATFVAVGVWTAPGRRDAVARIAVTVVGAFGVYALAVGAFHQALQPAIWGGCILMGGLTAYLSSRRLLQG